MKLKKGQMLSYQCDGCHSFKTHKDMFDECICYDCYDKRGESLSKPQASAHKEVPIRFVKNDLPSLIKLAKDIDEPQSATPKVCPQCGGTGVMGDKETHAECDSCYGTGKPIS